MNDDARLPVRIITGMVRALSPETPLPEGLSPRGEAGGVLDGMLGVFVRESGAGRAVAILLEPEAEVPRVAAAVPDMGGLSPCGEDLRAFLFPGPPDFTACGPDGEGGGAVFCGRPDSLREPGPPLAVAPFGVAGEDGRETRGALAVCLESGHPALAALPGAALLAARAVGWGQETARADEAHAAEVAMLRGRVLAGAQEAFGPGGCPGLAGVRAAVEQAARTAQTVYVLGEPGTGKARLARIIHDLSRRGTRPFATARAADMEAVFGRADAGMFFTGAVEDAAGGTLYVSDLDDPALAGDAKAQERLARLALCGEYARCGSDVIRRAGVRLVLGAGLPPRELADRLPGLAEVLAPARGQGPGMRLVRVPALRERPGDVPVLLQRAVELQAGRAGMRPSLTPRAIKILGAYAWPGNDEEVRTLAAEVLLAGGGERVDVEDLPSRVFSLPAAAPDGEEAVGAGLTADPAAEGEADTLWEMERVRVLAALERHGWVRTRAARELGLTPRQLGWRMKRHGLTRGG